MRSLSGVGSLFWSWLFSAEFSRIQTSVLFEVQHFSPALLELLPYPRTLVLLVLRYSCEAFSYSFLKYLVLEVKQCK